MNLGDIQTRVFRTFGDEASIQITPDDIIRWVNDAQRDIAITAGLLEVVATQNVTSGSFVQPANLLTLHAVSVGTPPTPIRFIPFDEGQALVGATSQEGSFPEVYWIFGRTVFLFPVANTDVTLYYTREPVEVSLVNDVIDLPINYHSRVVEYCMKQAYELDENFEAMALKGAEFDKNIQTQQNQEAWGAQKQYPFISASAGDL